MLIFYDTETTGLIQRDLPYSNEQQPRLVQLAMIVTDDNGKEMASFNSLIFQTNPIPPEATAIHGKTTEMCRDFGMTLDDVIYQLCDVNGFHKPTYVGFNIEYDKQIIAIAHECIEVDNKPWLDKEMFCVMKAMTDICKLPGKYPGKYKWPKLQEAYEFAFGKKFEGAHDALADVRATKDLYFWLRTHSK